LLSHGHRDHCDQASLKKIYQNNQSLLLTSLGLGKFVKTWLPKVNYQEAGWYQQYQTHHPDLKIFYLPAQHWSNRMLWDINKMLWGSFIIQYKNTTIFFGGDSGYSAYTNEIAALFPSIDFAMIGVGAYTPDFMMQDVHTSPDEAMVIAKEMNVKNFIPMHYGTFDLADEPMGEPLRILSAYKAQNKMPFSIHLPAVGEAVVV
jgi:L-ascorbate metabolism protein UlaG (beta-lactamase superfamily)